MSAPAIVSPFKRRTLIILIVLGVTSLGVALGLAAFSDEFQEETTAGTNGYSSSAVGYQALVELLRAVDVPVVVSQNASATRAEDGLLVVFAPEVVDEEEAVRLRAMVRGAPRVLLVLPRWSGAADPDNPSWIDQRHELPLEIAREVLAAIEVEGEVAIATGKASAPAWGPAPSLEATSQVVLLARGRTEVPFSDEATTGELVASTHVDDDTELWVVADPTPLDNAGLRRPGNPRFAVALIEHLRGDGPVVFDETLHGFAEKTPSLWKAMFRFPLVLVTLHVAVCTLLLLWAAVGRFGPARAAPPPIPSGKDFLIRNTADLLHVGGHDGDALRRYLATTVHHVRVALHAPRDLHGPALHQWLERVRASRGGSVSIVELEQDVWSVGQGRSRAAARRTVEIAARIHRWRTEMTHGPRHHS